MIARVLLILWSAILFLGICAALVIAQICPGPEPGYVPNPRPAEVAPNYPPPGTPACSYYTTSYYRRADGTVIHVASGYRETNWGDR